MSQQINAAGPVVGVVLAGGLSTRMYHMNKCFSPLKNKSLIDHVIDRLSPQVHRLVLNIFGDLPHLPKYDYPIIQDEIPAFAGPLAGIHAAMKWTTENVPDAKWLASAPTDTPFFPEDFVEKCLAAVSLSAPPAIVRASSGDTIHPVCSLWPISLKNELEEALMNGVRKVRLWTENYNVINVDFPVKTIGDTQLDPFFNINSPHELKEADQLIDAIEHQKDDRQ